MDSLVSRHISIKSPAEQEKMRVAGRLAAEVLDMIGEHVVPGVTTEELDRLCHDFIVNAQQAIPANVHTLVVQVEAVSANVYVSAYIVQLDNTSNDGSFFFLEEE